MSEIPVEKCLDFDPFEGDFGEAGDRTLSDKMVVARKAHQCSHCAGEIDKGERYRSRVEIFDGMMENFRWCPACCRVMAECEADVKTEKEWDRVEAFNAQWEARGSQGQAARAGYLGLPSRSP